MAYHFPYVIEGYPLKRLFYELIAGRFTDDMQSV